MASSSQPHAFSTRSYAPSALAHSLTTAHKPAAAERNTPAPFGVSNPRKSVAASRERERLERERERTSAAVAAQPEDVENEPLAALLPEQRDEIDEAVSTYSLAGRSHPQSERAALIESKLTTLTTCLSVQLV
jgi:hypothetical protein